MPYIKKDFQEDFAYGHRRMFDTPGELNYAITSVVKAYMLDHGLSYRVINDIIGALEGAKLEFYRRIAAPYEDTKIKENGDVY